MEPSDEEDRRLFETLLGPKRTEVILRLKRDDPEETQLQLIDEHLNEVASRRLGQILGQNTHVTDTLASFPQFWRGGAVRPDQNQQVHSEIHFTWNRPFRCRRNEQPGPILGQQPKS